MTTVAAAARAFIEQTGCRFYFDITPLFDSNWTGIPVVAANLATQLDKVIPAGIEFFSGHRLVAKPAVTDALSRGTGSDLAREFHSGNNIAGPLPILGRDHLSVGIFPSVKCVRGLFSIEMNIIHDLSTHFFPQYHSIDNILYHMGNIIDDLETNDLTICVSNSTMTDLIAYLDYPESRLILAPNGVAWPDSYEITARRERLTETSPEPYFYVLGTLEPRKNLSLIFSLLERYPDLLLEHRFVFSGESQSQDYRNIVPRSLAPMIEAGRLLFTGFVSEYQKFKLLRGAEATIYPSRFEGFGLPVLESLSLGTPCVASISSSIPEVGGDACFYFDPLSIEDLYRALCECARQAPFAREETRARCKTIAAKFTWKRMAARILRAVEPIARAKANRVRGPAGPEIG